MVRSLDWSRVYWRESRAHRYSLLFALPLLLLYEALAAALSRFPEGTIRNGADVALKSLFISLAGTHGPLVFGVLLIGFSIWLVGRDIHANGLRLQPSVFGMMLAESVVLALLFGAVVGLVTSQLLAPFSLALAPTSQLDWWTQLMVSLGAGLYEELLFRVLLVTALAAAGRRLFRWRPAVASGVAVVVGATIFSAFHYVGQYGDPFEVSSFAFRLVAGLFFSGLYVMRGFGITAWTHALYDVFLLV